SFRDRLVIHGLDLRHTPSIESFCHHLLETEPRLDHILHNACQTVRRPSGFYSHLMEAERAPLAMLPPDDQGTRRSRGALWARSAIVRSEAPLAQAVGLTQAPGLSQVELREEAALRGGASFPDGALDQDLQQIDRRRENSWRLTLAEVPTIELL